MYWGGTKEEVQIRFSFLSLEKKKKKNLVVFFLSGRVLCILMTSSSTDNKHDSLSILSKKHCIQRSWVCFNRNVL